MPTPYTIQSTSGFTVPAQPVTYYNTAATCQQNTFVWVQGEAGAQAYPVAPGNRVLLMDSDNPVLYFKSVDVTGKPLPIEIFDLVKREPSKQETASNNMDEYIKRDEIDALIEAKAYEILKKNRNKKEGTK